MISEFLWGEIWEWLSEAVWVQDLSEGCSWDICRGGGPLKAGAGGTASTMAHSHDYCQESPDHHSVPSGGNFIFLTHRSFHRLFEGTCERAVNFPPRRQPRRVRRKSQCFSWPGLWNQTQSYPRSVRSELLIPLHTQIEWELGSRRQGRSVTEFVDIY